MRIKYLEAALNQDIEFYDKEIRTSDVVYAMNTDTVTVQEAISVKVVGVFYCQNLIRYSRLKIILFFWADGKFHTLYDNFFCWICCGIYCNMESSTCYCGCFSYCNYHWSHLQQRRNQILRQVHRFSFTIWKYRRTGTFFYIKCFYLFLEKKKTLN